MGELLMLYAILTGVSLSMDAFAVSLTNGMTMKGFRFRHALIVAGYFGLFQFLMPLVGSFLAGTVADYIAKVGPVISFVLLASIGGKMLVEGIRCAKGIQNAAEISANVFTGGKLDHKKLFALSVATSIDALAVGVAMGVNPDYCGGIDLVSAGTIIGIVTFLICLGGCYAGRLIPRLSGEKAEILGGCILIGIGIKLLVEGLL